VSVQLVKLRVDTLRKRTAAWRFRFNAHCAFATATVSNQPGGWSGARVNFTDDPLQHGSWCGCTFVLSDYTLKPAFGILFERHQAQKHHAFAR
jgi:hypothetical protein